MLDVKLGVRSATGYVMASGSLEEISADIGTVISDLYKKLKQNTPSTAESFRQAMECLVADPESPVWNGELKADFGMMGVMPVKKDGDENV